MLLDRKRRKALHAPGTHLSRRSSLTSSFRAGNRRSLARRRGGKYCPKPRLYRSLTACGTHDKAATRCARVARGLRPYGERSYCRPPSRATGG